MPSLTRKVGQRILIGEAWVTVERIGQRTVQLRVEAPPEVRVRREEVVWKDATAELAGERH